MSIYGETGYITKLLHPVIGLGQCRKNKNSKHRRAGFDCYRVLFIHKQTQWVRMK